MQGHSASNLMPVIAANRVGLEEVEPCEANGNQKSALKFYGSSFITDGAGEVIESMDRDHSGVRPGRAGARALLLGTFP